ncbi:hypothetical protein GDO78_021818 [Eleutherodactylus coqui]|uniref:Uncharacterized protein n=1 Tax=Eleutherodactylus coqui TaxID=57060 RepID=A0A8J6B2S3_ELECQ|nr:hypothetical protein GDO78_021818 [Eleutherodactylus coqui]
MFNKSQILSMLGVIAMTVISCYIHVVIVHLACMTKQRQGFTARHNGLRWTTPINIKGKVNPIIIHSMAFNGFIYSSVCFTRLSIVGKKMQHVLF